MKPTRYSREGTLKGLLFLALIANLTWEPLTKHFSEVNLASTAGRQYDCTGKDKEICAAKSIDERNKMVQERDRLDAETKGSNNRTSAKPDGKIEAKASEACTDCLSTEIDAQIKAKTSTLAKLTPEVEKLSTRDPVTDRTETEAEMIRLAERRQNCEVDADGDRLTEVQELKCLTKTLAALKNKSDSSRKKEITRKIEDLYVALRKDARTDLLSKDSDRRSEGERSITEMLAALNGVRFERDSVRTEMIESLEALRAGAEARIAAADLEEDVSDLETEMKDSWRDMNKLTREFQNSCRTRSGCDRDVYEQIQDQSSRIGELKEEHYELAETINDEQEEAMDTLEDYRDSMSRSDLRDFTSPFGKLKSRMETMVDARKLGASSVGNQTSVDAIPGQDSRINGSGQAFIDANGLPADFYDVRNGAAAGRRTNGIEIAPQNQLLPMGSQQNIQTQMGQQMYSPAYMQPGMQQGQSLLPAPGGMNQMGMQMGMNSPMVPGQGQIVPVPGQQQFGQQQFGQQQFGQNPQFGGGPQILPAPRY